MADEKKETKRFANRAIGKDEKARGVFNASKVGRRYEARGWDDGEGEDAKHTVVVLVPGKSTEVPESVAAYLLGKLDGGKPRFSDLLDAEHVSPEATAAKNAALAENKRLAEENAALKAQIAELSKDDGKKKDGKDDGKKKDGGK